MDGSRRPQYFLQYHCIKWFWKALKAIMLVLLFQSHFHCFAQYLSRFVQPDDEMHFFVENFPHGALSFVIMWYSGQSHPLMLSLYFCCRINSNKINACRMGFFRYILHQDSKRINGYKCFLETLTALNESFDFPDTKTSGVGINAGIWVVVGKGEVLINCEERRLIWDNTGTVLLQLY